MSRIITFIVFAFLVSSTSADFILNIGGIGIETGDPGTVWDGLTLNGVQSGFTDGQDQPAIFDAGGILDVSGQPLPTINVFADTDFERNDGIADREGWILRSDPDPDPKFDDTAAMFGESVARQFFWGRHTDDDLGPPPSDGAIHNVRISGLAPGNYDVGVLSGSVNEGVTHDWYIQNELAGELVPESESQFETLVFPATVDASGDLIIGSDSDMANGNIVSLLQAIRVTESTGGGGGPDFNADGMLDCQDIDALTGEVVAATNSAAFDLTGDGLVDGADVVMWLADAGAENNASGGAYLPGDGNLDGVVDVSDFNIWNGNKFSALPAWCSGDFNFDGSIDVSDFNAWNGNKFNASDSVAAVPEPSSMLLLVISLVAFAARRPKFGRA